MCGCVGRYLCIPLPELFPGRVCAFLPSLGAGRVALRRILDSDVIANPHPTNLQAEGNACDGGGSTNCSDTLSAAIAVKVAPRDGNVAPLLGILTR